MTPNQLRVLKAIDSGDRVYYSHIAGRYYCLRCGEYVPELLKMATIISLRKRGLIKRARDEVQLTDAGKKALKKETFTL